MSSRRTLTIGLLALTAFALSCASKGGVGEHLVLEIIPSSVSFGAVDINSEHKQAVKLTHTGTSGTIRLKDIYFTDATSEDFWVDPFDVAELQPGDSTTILIHYKPTDSEADSGALIIDHNVPPDNEDLIYVSSLAPIAKLISLPNPIDFGEVPGGDFKDLDVRIQNYGSDMYTVNQIYLRTDGSKDFSIISDPVTIQGNGLPVDLNPDDEVGLVMHYEPKEGGYDESWLIVDGISKGEKEAFSFLVRGTELGPRIVVSPFVIDFGYVAQDAVETVDLTIENQGNDTLKIWKEGVQFDPASTDLEHLNIQVEGGMAKAVPAEELEIAPSESVTITLQWQAVSAVGNQGEPIGNLLIGSSDNAQSLIKLDIFGRVDAPILTLVPDAIDFLFVGQMITSKRPLNMNNEGTGELIINEAGGCFEIVGDDADGIPNEFGFEPTGGFAPSDLTSCGPGSIMANQGKTVTMTFTNLGPDNGTATATLKFTSNDPSKANVEVPLVAKRAGTPTCEPVLVPGKLDYGVVPKGFYKEKAFKLMNNGTGYCSFKSATIEDCSGLMGISVSCSEPGTGFGSKNYIYAGLPPAVQNGIGPGGHVMLKIRFTPPANQSVFGMLMTYPALASAVLYDTQLQKDIVIPEADGGGGIPGLGGWSPNLDGDSGTAKISILPGEVDFGLTTIGCFSQTFKVCVYNTGNAPLTISDLSFKNCSPEFKKKNVPPLPKDISAAVSMCFETVYAPQDEGLDTCHIHIESTDSTAPLVTVKLEGEGTFETEQTDIFTQVTGQEVDILMVIDDSGSMCGEQDKLIAAYDDFIQHAAVLENDYHIGIISMNVVDDQVVGMLNYGPVTNKSPRYMTPTSGSMAKFKDLADLGCNGGPHCAGFNGPCTDEQEAGLQAAQVALSAPLTTETDEPCNSDTDCHNNPNVCPDPAACGSVYCLEGTCGGWNKGFLREDAQLEIIALSDEEDQSSADIYFYIDFLKEIKGFYNVNMMHFNSIVGQSPSTCDEAGAGKRYIKVSQETNGVIGDLCDSSYSPIMNEIGGEAFGLKLQFFLTRLADPPTVKVWVNNDVCATGWTYDAPSNSIIFDENGSCMPQPGDEIKVYYKTLCLTE